MSDPSATPGNDGTPVPPAPAAPRAPVPSEMGALGMRGGALPPRAEAWTRGMLGPYRSPRPPATNGSGSSLGPGGIRGDRPRPPWTIETANHPSGASGIASRTTPSSASGAAPPVRSILAGSTRDDTLDELRRIIRRIETRHVPRAAPESIESVVGGDVVDTGAGPLLVARHAFPLSHRHGRITLGDAFRASADTLRVLARPGEEPPESGGLTFVDLETTGLAGGTGTYAFLVGVGALEGDAFVVTQYFMRDLNEEAGLLAALAPRFGDARGVVTFNGAAFDLPLLETRFVLARRRWPVDVTHVDLLRPSRRVWVGQLPDCRLGTVESHALGLERVDDVPGALIPTLYFQFLRTKQARPLARVFAHNRDDVLSLVALMGWFARALAGGRVAAASPGELAGLGRLLEPVDPDRAVTCYRGALEGGLSGPAALWTCLRLAAWEKRRERWDEACVLWQTAVTHAMFDPRPWEELAKFHEHRRRELTVARDLVVRAISLARRAGSLPRVLDDFAYRLARLERRLAAMAAAAR